MQVDSQESFAQPEDEEAGQPLPPGWNEVDIPPVLLALARKRPLEPLERASFELLLQIPDE